MPIKFIALTKTFIDKIKENGFESHQMIIEDYKPDPTKRTYYVSAANSLCFMDGGIDFALSRVIFPGIEPKIKKLVRELNIKNIMNRCYLPIGSSLIVDIDDKVSLIVAPTMLLPQNVSKTRNAYYATMAILYNILENRKENLSDIDILMTGMCCGYGKMEHEESIKQMLEAIRDYKTYKPTIKNENTIINEPNLLDQPKYYQNTEWFNINPGEIERII